LIWGRTRSSSFFAHPKELSPRSSKIALTFLWRRVNSQQFIILQYKDYNRFPDSSTLHPLWNSLRSSWLWLSRNPSVLFHQSYLIHSDLNTSRCHQTREAGVCSSGISRTVGATPTCSQSRSLSLTLTRATDLSEEQIKDMLSGIGHVEKFRLLTNPENGKPKGYGFATFSDPDAAASAVRNLDSTEIMGRKIRVDFSHDNKDDDQAPAGYNDSRPMAPNGANPSQPTPLPPLPPGVDLAPGITCPDSISRTLNTLPAPQLLDVLSQMKGLVMGDPARATELLRQAPQLSYAIFQALLLMGLVDTSVLGSVVEQASQPSQPPPQVAPIPPYMQQQHPQFPQVSGQAHTATPPVQPQPYGAPPPVQQPPVAQPPGQEELLKQVMAMSQQQVDALPPNERAQIMALRQALMGQGSF
jgi:cleavage stimulation factor subunit 2